MTDKPKLIRSVNDLVIGAALLLLGVFILTTKHVMLGTADTGSGGVLVRPDVYVRLIGGCIAFLSAILIVKSFNFRKSEKTEGFAFALNKEVAFTVAALVLYALLLPVIRFFASTFLLLFFLTVLYLRKEGVGEAPGKPHRTVVLKQLAIAAVYSVLMTIFVYIIFANVLKVSLP
jgi:hypothetical protein